MALSKTKMTDFRKELRILLSQEGYTNDQIRQLIFKPDRYVRFAYPRFAEFQMTVPDVNDGDRIDSNIDRDLLQIENIASSRIFGFGVFSHTTINYLLNEASYQEGFAHSKASDNDDCWEIQRVHLSDARSFLALVNRARKMIKKMNWLSGDLCNREGFRTYDDKLLDEAGETYRQIYEKIYENLGINEQYES